jgi:hypothetical protein
MMIISEGLHLLQFLLDFADALALFIDDIDLAFLCTIALLETLIELGLDVINLPRHQHRLHALANSCDAIERVVEKVRGEGFLVLIARDHSSSGSGGSCIRGHFLVLLIISRNFYSVRSLGSSIVPVKGEKF